MVRTTRHSAGAALELTHDGVLSVRLSGPLTAPTLHHVKAEIAQQFGGAVITAYVVDYRGAAVALTGAELDAVLEGERHGSTPSLPAAQIVSAELEPLFLGHCVRMAEVGIVRQVFTAEEPAFRWAARHARRARTKT